MNKDEQLEQRSMEAELWHLVMTSEEVKELPAEPSIRVASNKEAS